MRELVRVLWAKLYGHLKQGAGSASMKDPTSKSTKELPLVLAVNCLQECTIERRKLEGVARVESITGHSKAHQSLIKQVQLKKLTRCFPSYHARRIVGCLWAVGETHVKIRTILTDECHEYVWV